MCYCFILLFTDFLSIYNIVYRIRHSFTSLYHFLFLSNHHARSMDTRGITVYKTQSNFVCVENVLPSLNLFSIFSLGWKPKKIEVNHERWRPRSLLWKKSLLLFVLSFVSVNTQQSRIKSLIEKKLRRTHLYSKQTRDSDKGKNTIP